MHTYVGKRYPMKLNLLIYNGVLILLLVMSLMDILVINNILELTIKTTLVELGKQDGHYFGTSSPNQVICRTKRFRYFTSNSMIFF